MWMAEATRRELQALLALEPVDGSVGSPTFKRSLSRMMSAYVA